MSRHARPSLPAYTELNSSLGWNVTERLRLSISGFNPFHAWHKEYPGSAATLIPRSVFADVSIRF